MIKNVEELRKYKINEIEIIINKMNLFELSNLYNIINVDEVLEWLRMLKN